jgi:peptide chain release factor 3
MEVLTRTDGTMLALFTDIWRLNSIRRDLPDVLLDSLVAGDAAD